MSSCFTKDSTESMTLDMKMVSEHYLHNCIEKLQFNIVTADS
jgi:hypothetical protein